MHTFIAMSARTLLVLLSVLAASCGEDEPFPMLEALVIHPDEIDWAHVMEGREALAEAAAEYPVSNYGEAVAVDNMLEPQVSYLVPTGTPVYAPVTGTVVRIAELYSGDLTIQIGARGTRTPVWEVEHVIDSLVAEGDTVVAGQRIATASDASCNMNSTYCEYGIAVVELGLLTSRGHECPYAPSRIAPGALATVEAELDGLFDTLRALRGDPSAFNRDGWETSQCPTLDIVDPR